MSSNLEKNVKRWLKRKVSVSLAVLTLFAITGSVGYAKESINFSDQWSSAREEVKKAIEAVDEVAQIAKTRAENAEREANDAGVEARKATGTAEQAKKGLKQLAQDLSKKIATNELQTQKLSVESNKVGEGDVFFVDGNGNTEVKGSLKVGGLSTLGDTTVEGFQAIKGKNSLAVNKEKITIKGETIEETATGQKRGVYQSLIISVEGDSEEHVEGATKKEVYSHQNTNVTNDQTTIIGGDKEETVKGQLRSEVKESSFEIVNGLKTEEYNLGLTTKVIGNSTETIALGNKATKVDKRHSIIQEVVNGAKLEMDKDKNKFTKDVYVGSNPVLTENLQLADKDAIQIGKSIKTKEGTVENTAEARRGNIAFGYGNQVRGRKSMGNGYHNQVSGEESTSLGVDNTVEGNFSTVVGNNNSVIGNQATIVGHGNKVTGNKSTAVGTSNAIAGNNSGAFGDPNIVYGDNSYVFGNNNIIEKGADNNFILGNEVEIKGGIENSVALGNKSVISESNEVSVGSKGNERKVTNVADGRLAIHSTDTVNGRQLYRIDQKVNTVEKKVNTIDQRVNTVSQKVNAVAALGAALAGVDFAGAPVGKLGIGAGVGHFVNHQAVAVGVAYAPNEDFRVNAKWSAVAGTPKYNSVSVGATYFIDLR